MLNQITNNSFSRDPDACWTLLKSGDILGLEGLYRIFVRDLFQFGLSLVNDYDFVQDCIQEVFIDLWRYHKNLRTANNVKVYLFKSLSRKISKENYKAKRWKAVEVKESNLTQHTIKSIESEIIDNQVDKDIKQKLAKALDNLPLRQKEIILYLFFENFSYEEISRMMGINLRSVYTLAWKAISSLKRTVVSFGLFSIEIFF